MGRKSSVQVCSRVHGIIGIELLLFTSVTTPDVLEAGAKTTQDYMRP